MKANERLSRIEKAMTPSTEEIRQRKMAAALRALTPEDATNMSKEDIDAHTKEAMQRIGELMR